MQTPGPETKAKPKAKKLTDRTSAWKALDFEAEDDQKVRVKKRRKKKMMKKWKIPMTRGTMPKPESLEDS